METGIHVRAPIEGRWKVVDIGDPALSDEEVLAWLRSRGGKNVWAENTVLLLLGRKAIATI